MNSIGLSEVSRTLDCMHDAKTAVGADEENEIYVVRRLTPTECARLQGFPDDWGKLEGKPYSESAEYKMWGNGIALPNAVYVMEGIVDAYNKTLEGKED